VGRYVPGAGGGPRGRVRSILQPHALLRLRSQSPYVLLSDRTAVSFLKCSIGFSRALGGGEGFV